METASAETVVLAVSALLLILVLRRRVPAVPGTILPLVGGPPSWR